MTKKISGLFLIFIACYLGAHFYIRHKNTVYDDVSKIGRLIECEQNEFRKVVLRGPERSGSGNLTLERTDSPVAGLPSLTQVAGWRWSMVEPISAEADAALVRRLTATICELYDPRQLRDSDFRGVPANEKRASSLQFSLESSVGKRSFELQFGALRPDQTVEARLIRDGKPAGVFALPLILSQMVSLPNEAYRNLKVLRMEADNVQRAKLSIEGKERFTLERAGSDWKVFSGGRALGDGSEEAGRFLNRMTTLRGIGIAAEGQTSRDCDGMRARANLVLDGVAGQSEVVRFDYGKSGELRACSSLSTQRFRVHRDLLTFLDIPAASVLEKKSK